MPSTAHIVIIGITSLLLLPTLDTKLSAQNTTIQQNRQTGVLLLRNGQLLGGSYINSRFGYEILLQGGGLIRLKHDDVEFVSDSIDEIYSFRRASKVNNTAIAHLDMATWCLKNKLYDYAAYHLQQAIKINPRESGIIPVQTRLAIAQRGHKQSRLEATVVRSGTVVSNDTVVERINQLENTTIHSFVTKIQPLLLNKCAVAACHGPNSRSSYQLINSRWTKTTPRNISYRNLYNTLRYIDFDSPERSRLLLKGTSHHGGMKSDSFVFTQGEQLGQLLNLVRTLTVPVKPVVKPEAVHIPNHSPIMFRSVEIDSNSPELIKKVELPTNHIDAQSVARDKTHVPPIPLPEYSEDMAETALSKRFREGEAFKPIIFSREYEQLPFDRWSGAHLKVFSPRPSSTTDLTPKHSAVFTMPSYNVINSLIPSSQINKNR